MHRKTVGARFHQGVQLATVINQLHAPVLRPAVLVCSSSVGLPGGLPGQGSLQTGPASTSAVLTLQTLTNKPDQNNHRCHHHQQQQQQNAASHCHTLAQPAAQGSCTGQPCSAATELQTNRMQLFETIAALVQKAFVDKELFGSCIAASVIFCEAVESAVPEADPQVHLGYVVAPAGDRCGRHMCVRLDGQHYDLGYAITAELKYKLFGSSARAWRYSEEQPACSECLGWMDRSGGEEVALQQTGEEDARLLRLCATQEGRAELRQGWPAQLLELRQRVLKEAKEARAAAVCAVA